ncbi:unnamed protein product [Moneuplotes crassus]|uniref:Uncharacterized protein n=1 Tax=Euplotes crassus TaxID=5936 RepID=A0AAD1XME7_EUPCR|nr:unnamed protein product [Moneuplotes crassus]
MKVKMTIEDDNKVKINIIIKKHPQEMKNLQRKSDNEEAKECCQEANNEETKEPRSKRGRGRPRKYQNPDFYTRNTRLDINDKTLIRAVRREFVQWFRVFCISTGLHTSDVQLDDHAEILKMRFEMSDGEFDNAMDAFIPHILQQETSDSMNSLYSQLQNLKDFLIVLIDPSKGTSIMFPGTTRLLKDEMRSLFFSYSHRKLEVFLAVPEMRYVLHKTLNSEYIDTLIAKNPTLNESEALYKECAEKIMDKVTRHNRAAQM